MQQAKIIDADAHIVESEAMWDCLEGRDKQFRPTLMSVEGKGSLATNYWLVDGIVRTCFPPDATIPEGVRDLTDVPGRIKKLDEMGIDVQVLYPSLFLGPFANRAEVMVALCRCYNRFMAKAAAQADGRLRWVVAAPAVDMDETVAEVEFGKQNGACGVMLRGIEADRILSDPYFFPLYEKADALDLPICVHIGNGNTAVFDTFKASGLFCTRSPVLSAFQDILSARIPEKFPRLRFGFIEAGSEWIPYVLGEVVRKSRWLSGGSKLAASVLQYMGKEVASAAQSGGGVAKVDDRATIMRDNRLFVSCRISDDLQYVLRWAGAGNLVTGTDYGHDDYSRELDAFAALKGTGEFDAAVIDGICGANARVLYAIQ